MENDVEEYSHVLDGRIYEVLHLCQAALFLLEEVDTVLFSGQRCCYVCIDLVAIKDMRNITDHDSGDFVVCLHNRDNDLMDDDESGDDNDEDAHGKLEELPRRQLRLICSGDRVMYPGDKARNGG